jgi:large subunit ribosomal protein L15e
MTQTWLKMWKSNSNELKSKAISWRAEPTINRIERPSRLDRARRLGYKAKQGIVVVRVRVSRGGMRKQRPVSGRRPKHIGVVHIKQGISMRKVAERRVNEKYPNLEARLVLSPQGRHKHLVRSDSGGPGSPGNFEGPGDAGQAQGVCKIISQ